MHAIWQDLEHVLIVSCQPVPGGPFDTVAGVVAFARAAVAGGARGLRIEGAANVAAVVQACRVPVIGLVKRDLPGTLVRITPCTDDVDALVTAGAHIVAVDATLRDRPVPVAVLLARIRGAGAVAMADCATPADAGAAVAAGAQCVGSTLAGYMGGAVPAHPDLALVRALRREMAPLGVPIVAEGRYNTPALAAEAIEEGAWAVVVGSAITRPEHVTAWFRDAVAARRPAGPVLAFDIGGTKTLAALVQGRAVLERHVVPTDRRVGPDGWIQNLVAMADRWQGRYDRAALAVTGVVSQGRWSTLNPDILAIPPAFPLRNRIARALGVPVMVVNDAQAAAWGEYRFGAGANTGAGIGTGQDMVFVTVSSGIGGGVVISGRLLQGHRGIAGSLGQTRYSGGRLEDRASGFAMQAAARRAGHDVSARDILASARLGEAWADRIVAEAVLALAEGLIGLQAVVDPGRMVIGGGVGLADGYLTRVRAALSAVPETSRPVIVPARLGADCGAIGAVALAACV